VCVIISLDKDRRSDQLKKSWKPSQKF